MQTSRLDFSGARNIINPEAELAKTFGQTSSTLDKMIAQSAEKKRAEEALKQQAIQNQMAREGLDLRQAAGEREAGKYAREIAGDEALRTYTQQLSNVGGMLSTTDADKLRQLYNKGGDVQSSYDAMIAPSKIEEMRTLAMPSGDYDPTSLIAAQEKAIAKPQGTLDSIVAAKAAEEKRIQANKDKEALAWQKEQWIRGRNKGGSKSSKLLYDKDGNAIEWTSGNEIPKGYMESSMYNKIYGDSKDGKPNSKRADEFTKMYETVQEFGNFLSDDVKTSEGYLKKLDAIGADTNTVKRIVTSIKGQDFDKVLDKDALNRYGGVVYDPKTGKSLKYGDAIDKAFEEDLVLTVDDKGLPTFAPKAVDDTFMGKSPEHWQQFGSRDGKVGDASVEGQALQNLIEEQGKKEEQAEIPKNILDLLGFERPQRQRSVIQEDIDPETGFYRNQALEDTSLDFIGAGFANKVRKIQAAKNMSKAAKEAAIEKVRKQFAKAGNQVEGIVGSPTYLRKQGTAAARDLKDEIAKATARRKEVVSSGATAPVKPGYPYSNITKKLDKTDDALLEKLLKEKDMLEKELKQFR